MHTARTQDGPHDRGAQFNGRRLNAKDDERVRACAEDVRCSLPGRRAAGRGELVQPAGRSPMMLLPMTTVMMKSG